MQDQRQSHIAISHRSRSRGGMLLVCNTMKEKAPRFVHGAWCTAVGKCEPQLPRKISFNHKSDHLGMVCFWCGQKAHPATYVQRGVQQQA
eukprot:1137999-Pelagomonas_calceolata.AAC.2